MRPVGSPAGGVDLAAGLAGQSGLEDDADDRVDADDEATDDEDWAEPSCDETRALTNAGSAATRPRVAINTAVGSRDFMTITFRPRKTTATLGAKL